MLDHDLLSDETSPEKIHDQNNLSKRLINAIMQLEPNYRQIIVLRFINQLSHKEAAQTMRLGYNNVRVLQHRALKQLRALLSEEEN